MFPNYEAGLFGNAIALTQDAAEQEVGGGTLCLSTLKLIGQRLGPAPFGKRGKRCLKAGTTELVYGRINKKKDLEPPSASPQRESPFLALGSRA